MTRKKLNLAYITNDSMRKTTFNKRKEGLVKKMQELSVLCGIEACGIIYSPFTSNPEVWPSNNGVKKVIEKFETIPEAEQKKKMVNHQDFLIESINKTMDNNNKKVIDNKERTTKEAVFMFLSGQGQLINLNSRDRVDMCKYIDQYVKELLHHKNVTLNQGQFLETSSTSNVIAPTPKAFEVGSSSCQVHGGFNTNNHQLVNELKSLNLNQNQHPQHNQEWLVGQMINHGHDQIRYYQ